MHWRHRVPALTLTLSSELGDVVRSGDEGMMSYAESLVRLHHDKLIDTETGCHAAPNEEEFKRMLAGIKTSQVGIVG